MAWPFSPSSCRRPCCASAGKRTIRHKGHQQRRDRLLRGAPDGSCSIRTTALPPLLQVCQTLEKSRKIVYSEVAPMTAAASYTWQSHYCCRSISLQDFHHKASASSLSFSFPVSMSSVHSLSHRSMTFLSKRLLSLAKD